MMNNITADLSLLLITLPVMGLMMNVLSRTNEKIGAQLATLFVGTGLALSLLLLGYCYGKNAPIYFFGLKVDGLSLLMTSLIFFVSTVIHQFSVRYMAGDRHYKAYYIKLSLITATAALMALSDNLLMFFAAWCVSNCILIAMMIHKQQWPAASFAGKLTFKTFFIGGVFLMAAMVIMYFETQSLSITTITQQFSHSPLLILTLLLCIIAAMTQSALWPFHRWLTSSLNSPTPVSAMMHAGLVNGGGFLLVRFAPLLAQQTSLLDLIFLVGMLSAAIGTLWKLVQSDVKRMLACSTMGQMGFMMTQCGLGLFPAAIAHLIWHGLFKAFLFLNAGSAVLSHKGVGQNQTSTFGVFILSLLFGLLGTYAFAWMSDKSFFSMNTTTFLVGFAFIALTQIAHAVLQNNLTWMRTLLAIAASLLCGTIYGCTIHLIEAAMPSTLSIVRPISGLHLTVWFGFLSIWLLLNLKCLLALQKTTLWKRCYMALLNGSQPHKRTITAIRNSYHY